MLMLHEFDEVNDNVHKAWTRAIKSGTTIWTLRV